MKVKKINKKLTLSKQTIANLKVEELNSVKGGAPSNRVCGGTDLTLCCPEPVTINTCLGC
jgi:natural product precursor